MHLAGLKTPEAYDGKCNNRNKNPLTLSIVPLIYTGIPICSVATFVAVQEGHFIRTGKGIKT